MNILGLLLFAFVNELIGIVIGMELWEKLDEYAENKMTNDITLDECKDCPLIEIESQERNGEE